MQYTFSSSEYKTATLPKITEALQYSNIVFMCEICLHTESQLPFMFCT